MAERIVSPGVFARERDLSFLPQGVSEIGAAIVGPTKKGPAFVPTSIRNFEEFEQIFGSYDSNYYTPFAVKNYLDSAGTVTIVKVGYLGGYKVSGFNLVVSGANAAATTARSHHKGQGPHGHRAQRVRRPLQLRVSKTGRPARDGQSRPVRRQPLHAKSVSTKCVRQALRADAALRGRGLRR